MRRRYRPHSRYAKKIKNKRKIIGKGLFAGYANLLSKIIKKTL